MRGVPVSGLDKSDCRKCVHIWVFERDMHSITEVQSLANRRMYRYWGLKGCTIRIGWLCMLALPVQCYRSVKRRGRACQSIMEITCMMGWAVCLRLAEARSHLFQARDPGTRSNIP